ncbi:MAG: metal-sensing transcriptional repressor [bacterium]
MKNKADLSVQERLLHRIRIVEGHLKSIEEMIERGEYCVHIIHQTNAVQKALKNINSLIMENHLNTCVVNQIKAGEAKNVTEELLKLYGFQE